ncbi:Dehydrodolichyl diphosphate synthase complex subunit nus1 isoform 1 [Schistosoma japonicum]|uniref:ditrans,polycis-polyprenyl diphosphate synthase [(2E,6E)-farnesyldiphosphate specific] n=1 Tax=Schistosoma japonicum TaxID=6182 RepID=Q86FJ5_SCHJA|nr:similar to GenBank Accession Number BC003223 unknown (protein for MGC:7199) in Mus musculus [Schistosoma japonicum]TNN11343.1 Dehydrodolichyl diphosphate synthase complex subunit nus1 isoform 1 [Schistosoma japonicum]
MMLTLITFLYKLKIFVLKFLQLLLLKSSLSAYFQSSWSDLDKNNTKLPKIPQHISFVIFEEIFSAQDIANLIIWCSAIGVSYLSMSDMKGNILHLRDSIEQFVKEKNFFVEKDKTNKSSVVYNPLSCVLSKITVNYLGCDDGFDQICQSARYLSTSNYSLTDEKVNQTINELTKVPDVDLTIHCGLCSSFSGLLPWQSRFSEFIRCPSVRGLEMSDFRQILYRFGKVKQRWGR